MAPQLDEENQSENRRPPEASEVVDKQADKEYADLLVADIDERLQIISRLKAYAREHEELELAAEARSFSLPPADATDKLLRYEAHWTGSFIAPWTNLSVYRGSAEEKMCRLPSTLIWGEGDNICDSW